MTILHWFISDFTVGFFIGILCHHYLLRKKKLPKPLEGTQKLLFPPNDTPKCLGQAFLAGCTSNYLDTSIPHEHWKKACKAYSME